MSGSVRYLFLLFSIYKKKTCCAPNNLFNTNTFNLIRKYKKMEISQNINDHVLAPSSGVIDDGTPSDLIISTDDDGRQIMMNTSSETNGSIISNGKDAVDVVEESNHNSDDDDDESAANCITDVPETFYGDAKKYWNGVAATVDGMLGGFGSISNIDVRASTVFLRELYKMKPAPSRRVALDCGAGIGRVTKHLLIPLYQTVDVVEQDTKFASTIKEYVADAAKLGTVFNMGLQQFTPAAQKYDLIWSQWVLGHLTDDDLVAFFKRCILGLARNGVMVIKENVTATDSVDVDVVDSSVTRPLVQLKALIAKSGMRIIRMTRQQNFPKGLFPVYMITLKPPKMSV